MFIITIKGIIKFETLPNFDTLDEKTFAEALNFHYCNFSLSCLTQLPTTKQVNKSNSVLSAKKPARIKGAKHIYFIRVSALKIG